MKLVELTDYYGHQASINPSFVTCIKQEKSTDGEMITLVYVTGPDHALVITKENYNDVISKLSEGK
ncbi:hypothetical protein [Paenibacillus naphthalenovorans]|uniref:hypothetical protein n=1 Tax=Paenibacillus naphthalenovorans TaxID=162209 RepID=UPI0008879EC2|nr:hypothetical protein [Paenibacillus naphthalenovorans]SDJ60882.1 hypothetical protein SAMN05421868_13425 [Paenibacillus naphthalenovorans]